MAYTKRLVCLANSFKIGGNCIAGREVLGGGNYGPWIRPVSSRPIAELWPVESRYEDNSQPKLLDVIDVPLMDAAPHNHQSENHVVDASRRWKKIGVLPWEDLEELCEHPASLWTNRDSTYNGACNCVSELEAAELHDSLVLIRPDNFTVEVTTNPWKGRKDFMGRFTYRGMYCSLKVTDPVVVNELAAKDVGEYDLNGAYLCISLTEPWEKDNNRCHKLVAGVLRNPRQA